MFYLVRLGYVFIVKRNLIITFQVIRLEFIYLIIQL